MNGTIGTSGMGTLGILLGNDDNGALIIRDLDSSSPNSASVFIGDVILAVNDVDVANKPLAVAKPLLQGPPGASVRLRLFRVGTGETMVTLVRHLPSSSGLLGTPDPMAPPVHRLVRWDEKSKKQISEVCPMSKNTPKGHVDIVIIDVQNLPVSYEMGWSISSSLLGSILSNPYVVAKQGGVMLQSSVQSNKLSAAYNQTLRLPVSALEDLVIQVRNNDAIEAGDLIGEVVFPIQQLARVGEVQTGRFRLSVAGESKTRIPVLQGMQVGEVVTGLKGRPSSVALELHYSGEPYEELRAGHQVEEEYARLMVEREALEAEKAQLIKVPLPGRGVSD